MTTVALFIDADNIPAPYHHDIIKTAKQYGTLTIKRVYTNWSKNTHQAWKDPCVQYGLSAVQQFDHVAGKNASDMAISIDVMEALFVKSIDVFCLVSSDSDFTPLCLKLQEYGKTVIGMGSKSTSKSLVNACHEFHYLIKEEVVPPVILRPVDSHSQKHRPNPNNDDKLIKTITQLIYEHGDNHELNIAKLGQLIRLKNPDFSPSLYGYEKIGEMLKAMGKFDVITHHGTPLVRLHQDKATSTPLDSNATPAVQSALSSEALLKDTVLTNALSNAIATHQDTKGWAMVSLVDDYLKDTFGILSQNYGYQNTTELIKNLSMLFELKKHSGVYYTQDKRALSAPKSATTSPKKSTKQLRQDKQLISALTDGISIHTDEHGWASCQKVGAYLKNLGLSAKDYGYRNLTELTKALALFELKSDGNTHHLKDPNIKSQAPKPAPKTAPKTDVPSDLLTGLTHHDDTLQSTVQQALSVLSSDGSWVQASKVSDYLRRQHGLTLHKIGFDSFAKFYDSLEGIACQKQGRVLFIKTSFPKK